MSRLIRIGGLLALLIAVGCASRSLSSPTEAPPSPSSTPAPGASVVSATLVPTVSAVTVTSGEPTTTSTAPSTIAPASSSSPTTAPSPPIATATSSRALTVDQIAATAVAESIGEQCVAAPPKPAKGFVGDPARGKLLFVQRGCAACHGDLAQGGVGPKLAGTSLSFEAVIRQLRQPRGVMQRYLPADQSDADECDVYVYLRALALGSQLEGRR